MPSCTNIFSTVSTPAKASNTNLVNIVSLPVRTASRHEGLSLSDPTNPEEDDSEIPPFEDIYQNSTDGIFTNSSYDDEGAVADFTNLETVVNVSLEAAETLAEVLSQIKTKRRNVKIGVRRRLDAEDVSTSSTDIKSASEKVSSGGEHVSQREGKAVLEETP
ncbi:hypothetical protein Tco_0121305 [Tanacetum coccineum]